MTDGAFAALEERANQLMLQLHAVGGELAETRAVLAQQVAVNESLQRQLTAIETGVAPASSASARRYRDREALILLPRVLELFAPDDALVVVDGGAREG